MACCVKLEPLWVDQWAGPWFQSGGFIAPRVRRWSMFYPETESEEGNGQYRVRHDWDEAFEELEYACLVTYPDELKYEAFEVQDGTYSVTFRVEFADSADCDDGETEEYQYYQTGMTALFRLRICSPVTLKAVSVGSVSNNGYGRPAPGFTAPYQWYDRLDVSVTHSEVEVGACSEDEFIGLPGAEGTWQRLLCGHEETGGATCDMIERRDCGVASFCEGVRYLRVNMNSGDGQEHLDGYYEVTLTFECGESTMDCTAEEAHENYLPCDFGGFDPPCTPPVDPEDPQPGECGSGTVVRNGDCYCGTCTVTGIRLTLSGFTDSFCEIPLARVAQGLWSAINGTYVLTATGSGTFKIVMGEQGNCEDPGILVNATTYEGDGFACSIYVYEIEASLSCVTEGESIRWSASAAFSIQSIIQGVSDPCTPVVSCDDSGFIGTCVNLDFETETDHSNGCSGGVTYRTEGLQEYGFDEHMTCNCYEVAGNAYAQFEVIGSEGCED